MAGPSQQELEQPAKVYQLNAVDAKVDQALQLLGEINKSVTGVVTVGQMEAHVRTVRDELAKEFDTKLATEVKAIHLKYSPTYKGIWWAVSGIGSILIAILVNNIWGAK